MELSPFAVTPVRLSPRSQLRWGFTLVLGVAYLGIFHLWTILRPPWIAISGLGLSVCLGALLLLAAKRRYFVNVWDGTFHGLVILDIVLEATWINQHDHAGFYLCAAAFAIVLAGYRLWFCRDKATPHRLRDS
jgi:hypothetical protein